MLQSRRTRLADSELIDLIDETSFISVGMNPCALFDQVIH